MSTTSHNNLKLGRVAPTKSNSIAMGVPPGTWVCIVRGAYSPTQAEWDAAGQAGAVPANTNKRFVDVIGYPSQDDAYMESAHVTGSDQGDDESAVASRRSMSYNNKGIIRCVSTAALASCGIGNNVEGFINNENRLVDDAFTYNVITKEDKALSALAKLQPTLVGARSNKWQVMTDGNMTLHDAVVSSVDKNDVFGDYYEAYGVAAGTFSMKMNVAASYFTPTGGVDLPSVDAQDWERLVAWAGARMALEDVDDGHMITGAFIMSFAAALGELEEQEIHRLSGIGCLMSGLRNCLVAINQRVSDIIDPALAISSAGLMPTVKQLAQAVIDAPKSAPAPLPLLTPTGATAATRSRSRVRITPTSTAQDLVLRPEQPTREQIESMPGCLTHNPMAPFTRGPAIGGPARPTGPERSGPSPLGREGHAVPWISAGAPPFDDSSGTLATSAVFGRASGIPRASSGRVANTCRHPTCDRDCYLEDSGHEHDYCGRTCAEKDGALRVSSATDVAVSSRVAGLRRELDLLGTEDSRYGPRVVFFYGAAANLGSMDSFLRGSVMHTIPNDTLRRSAFVGDSARVHLNCAANLEAFLEEALPDKTFAEGLLPRGAEMTTGDLSSTLNSLAGQLTRKKLEYNHSTTDGAQRQPTVNVAVRTESVLAAMPVDEREEGSFLLLMAEKVQQEGVAVAGGRSSSSAVLRKLDDIHRSGDLGALKKAVDESGEHLSALLTSSSDWVERVAEQQQWPSEQQTILRTLRQALEKRVWIAVSGAGSAYPSPGEKKAFAFLRQGWLGRARPMLLVRDAPTSPASCDDPLSFLAKMPNPEQLPALLQAFMLISLALAVSFPAHGLSSQRWIYQVGQFIMEQRRARISWGLISAWYAGLCKRADMRNFKLMRREATTLTALDIAWIRDSAASYNQEFQLSRAGEIARLAAIDAAAEKSNTPNVRAVASPGSTPGKKRAAASPASANGNPKRAARIAAPAAPKSAGGASSGASSTATSSAPPAASSGRKLNDPKAHVQQDGRFIGSLTEAIESITKELGTFDKGDGKGAVNACPFFHIRGSCKDTAASCRNYH